jgi:2-polyprenyl-6-methoxyphenol hydroxylase-like FAD-dependent oxidoreductase
VGVNYAIQDAVALSNAIADDLAAGTVPEAALARVQARRERPVRAMQRIQRFAHRGLGRVTRARGDRFMPRPIAAGAGLLQPLIQCTLAQLIGYGFLPERPDLRDAVGERPA